MSNCRCGGTCESCRNEHIGFDALKDELEDKGDVDDPAAVAAAIGRKKYGAAGMARKSAAARNANPEGVNQYTHVGGVKQHEVLYGHGYSHTGLKDEGSKQMRSLASHFEKKEGDETHRVVITDQQAKTKEGKLVNIGKWRSEHTTPGDYKTAFGTGSKSLKEHLDTVHRTPTGNEYVVNPAVSEAQRRYLNHEFGHDWVKEHHFDNKGSLPEYKEDEDSGATENRRLPEMVTNALQRGESVLIREYILNDGAATAAAAAERSQAMGQEATRGINPTIPVTPSEFRDPSPKKPAAPAAPKPSSSGGDFGDDEPTSTMVKPASTPKTATTSGAPFNPTRTKETPVGPAKNQEGCGGAESQPMGTGSRQRRMTGNAWSDAARAASIAARAASGGAKISQPALDATQTALSSRSREDHAVAAAANHDAAYQHVQLALAAHDRGDSEAYDKHSAAADAHHRLASRHETRSLPTRNADQPRHPHSGQYQGKATVAAKGGFDENDGRDAYERQPQDDFPLKAHDEDEHEDPIHRGGGATMGTVKNEWSDAAREAAAASRAANKAGAAARKSGSSDDHYAAARFHTEAAAAHMKSGNMDKAAEHVRQSGAHMNFAGPGTMNEKRCPECGKPMSECTCDTGQTDYSASSAPDDGDLDDEDTGQTQYPFAKFKQKMASEAGTKKATENTDMDDLPPEAQRAAAYHMDMDKMGGAMTQGAHAASASARQKGTAAAHKHASDKHYEAHLYHKEAEQEDLAKHHLEKAKYHAKKMKMSTNSNSNTGGKMRSFHRGKALRVLTANCVHDKDKAAFNAMSDEQLARLLRNAQADSSDMEVGPDGEIYAGGYKESKGPGKGPEVAGESDSDTEMEDDGEGDMPRKKNPSKAQATANYLSRMPPEVRAVVVNALRRDRQEKVALMQQLVGHLPLGRREAVVNQLRDKTLEQLQLVAQIQQPTYNEQAPTFQQQRRDEYAALFVGNAGGPDGSGGELVDNEADVLTLPSDRGETAVVKNRKRGQDDEPLDLPEAV